MREPVRNHSHHLIHAAGCVVPLKFMGRDVMGANSGAGTGLSSGGGWLSLRHEEKYKKKEESQTARVCRPADSSLSVVTAEFHRHKSLQQKRICSHGSSSFLNFGFWGNRKHADVNLTELCRDVNETKL